jgi:hypothetical protein
MAQGPELTVVRKEAIPGKAAIITLGRFTLGDVNRLFPMGGDGGKGVRFLPTAMQGRLNEPTAGRYFEEVVRSSHVAAWAVCADGQAVGLASLHVSPVVDSMVGYSVVLGLDHHGRGIGEMTTAGIMQAASMPGMLAETSHRFPDEVQAVGAQVNGRHAVAAHMLSQAGFLHVHTSGPTVEDPALWWDYVRMMPDFEASGPAFAERDLEVAAERAAASALRFSVEFASA